MSIILLDFMDITAINVPSGPGWICDKRHIFKELGGPRVSRGGELRNSFLFQSRAFPRNEFCAIRAVRKLTPMLWSYPHGMSRTRKSISVRAALQTESRGM